ncbi:MAG: hypothetical protein HC785_08575 [Calothrix sp. CSU_2_0]|nr:hypothetical protein [Calothrix sp. CSU_2_0]
MERRDVSRKLCHEENCRAGVPPVEASSGDTPQILPRGCIPVAKFARWQDLRLYE